MASPDPQFGLLDMRAHLAAIVDWSDDAILSKDVNGTVISWNKGAEKLYGYTAQEVIGQHISLLVPEDRPEEVADILTKIRRGETVDHFETVRIRKDGSAVPVALTISPIRTPGGDIVGASTIARDISDRRRADELRFRLAAIVDSSDDAILSKTLEGTILSWNKGAQKLYGYTPEEVIGRHISLIVPDGRPNEVPGILAQLRRGEMVHHFETLRVRKDGTTVPVSLTVSPVRNADGVIIGASAIARDITERRRLQAVAEAARERALELSRVKSDFLATMSHEIRTPLNGVIGMTGMLLDTELTPEQRTYADTIRHSGEALLAIVNDILDFSRIEAGKLDLEMIDFNLRNVVEEVADLLAEQAQRKGLELVTLVGPDVPTDVRGDPGRLRQVLTNLVGNAVKFTRQGEVVIRAVEAQQSPDEIVVRIEVSDTGIGIDPEAMPAMFEPFLQADSSTTRTYGGSGLGLAITRQLVELMGGEIEVDTELGRGSTFTFTVRLQQPRAARSTPPRDDLSGLRVLIVDDNAKNRTILGHQVQSWGMSQMLAEDGVTALEELREAARRNELPDVALIDMDMPEMDGIALAEAVHNDPVLAPIPLLLLTSAAVRGSAATARDAGFSAYLPKPVRQSQLFDAIAAVLGAPSAMGTFVTRHTIAESRAESRPRLLVAEDNTVNQQVAVAMLTKLGYRADVVANGREAVEAVSRAAYGAVLMDCQMPEMDGYEATTQIRQREEARDRVPIIAMTAGAMASDRQRCLAAGMDDYLAKPVKLEELEAVLQRWTETPPSERAAAPLSNGEDLVLDAVQVADLRSLGEGPDGQELLTGLVTRFLDSANDLVRQLRDAAAARDGEEIRRLGHTLVGSSASFGARVVQQLARELEATTDDFDVVDGLLDRLELAMQELAPLMRAAFLSPAPQRGEDSVDHPPAQ